MITDEEMDMMQIIGDALDKNTNKIRIGSGFIYKDEEINCKYFHPIDEMGRINVCKGNEPYSCHRAKKEGLCHKGKLMVNCPKCNQKMIQEYLTNKYWCDNCREYYPSLIA